MKSLKYLLAVAALMGAFALSAQAHLEFVGAVSFESQPNNNPDSNLAALGGFVDTTGFVLCGNSDDGDFGNPITNPISVMAGSYLVIHYGKGNDGSSKGGGIEIYQVVDGETSVDVPLFGTSGFGNGGISSIREFCGPTTNVPDSGTTAMLLGGMGPVDAPKTNGGKLFAGLYAMYAGLVFLVAVAVVLSPILHRVLHKFHWEPDR